VRFPSAAAAFFAGTLFGVLSVWPARSQRAVSEQQTSPSRASVVRPAATAPISLQFEQNLLMTGDGPHRNLFAFPPERVLQTRPATTAPVVEVTAVIEPQPQNAVPAFPYRYIGSFGPRDKVFAVFAGNGEVMNVRPGETISGRFTLDRVGVESAEVSWDGHQLRVPLTR
jgi:hypothetical protein